MSNLIGEYAHLLRCPLCAASMRVAGGRSLICANRHSFDIARQGYVNLAPRPRPTRTKYNKRLFESRRTMCESGMFAPLCAAVSDIIAAARVRSGGHIRLLDAGCGEGSLLHAVRDNVIRRTGRDVFGIGIDIAKAGISLAARDYPHLMWCVADLAACPLAGEQFNVIANVLSPSHYGEFRRLLAADGIVVKAVPESGHLQEIRAYLEGRAASRTYSNKRTVARFRDHFKLLGIERVRYRFPLDGALMASLLQMSPLSWGMSEERRRDALEADVRSVTVDLAVLTGKRI